jgi:hypothetical protein
LLLPDARRIASVARVPSVLGWHLAASWQLRSVARRHSAEKVAGLHVLLLDIVSHSSVWRLLLRHELLLLLSQLHGTLIVLEDRCVEVLLQLISVLPVHDDAVLRLADLLLGLHAHGEGSWRLACDVLEIASLSSRDI